MEAMTLIEGTERESATKLLQWKDCEVAASPTWNHYDLLYSTSYELSRIALSLQSSQDDSHRFANS